MGLSQGQASGILFIDVFSQHAPDSARAGEYQISCGYFGWYICYEKAGQLCPGGYKVVSESEEHFGGRKLRISCEGQK